MAGPRRSAVSGKSRKLFGPFRQGQLLERKTHEFPRKHRSNYKDSLLGPNVAKPASASCLSRRSAVYGKNRSLSGPLRQGHPCQRIFGALTWGNYQLAPRRDISEPNVVGAAAKRSTRDISKFKAFRSVSTGTAPRKKKSRIIRNLLTISASCCIVALPKG